MARRDEEIRSYGPGKFNTVIDSYVYDVTLDGGADEEESYPEGGGWYGLVWLDRPARDRVRQVAAEHGDRLNAYEEALLEDSVAVILFERSDGIVEADWFDDGRDAQMVWDEIAAEFEEIHARYEEG